MYSSSGTAVGASDDTSSLNDHDHEFLEAENGEENELLCLCEISQDKHSIIKPHLSDEVFILPLLRSGTQ